MFEIESRCTSNCTTCGRLCNAFPITDLSSLSLLQKQDCTVIVGDLYIANLPTSVSNGDVYNAVKNVQEIRGTIFMVNNLYRTSMDAFRNLKIAHDIVYSNNPNMIDSRMPSLVSLGSVSVMGCDRLCPARYTVVGSHPDGDDCVTQDADYFFSVVGGATAADINQLSDVIETLMRNFTNNSVCS